MTITGRPNPPRLAVTLVRLLPAAGDGRFLAADMAEEFQDLAEARGLAAARRWYWKQAFLSAPPLVRQRISTFLSAARARRGNSRMLQSFVSDLGYGWRMGRRSPVVTVCVTIAIALGIAATTAIFSVMEGVFIRPLPFPAPDRLVRFSTVIESFGRAPEVNFLDAQDWRAAATRFESIGLYDVEPGTVRLADGAPPFSATIMNAGAGLVPALGIRADLGRALLPEEYVYGGPSSVLLGHRFWRSHFGGDPAVVGRSIQLGTQWRTIVGVLPPAADRFPAGGADIWAALTFPPSSFLNQRGSIALSAIGRLRPDATLAAAQQEISTIAARLAATYPDTNRVRKVALDALQDAMVGPVKPMMLWLAGSIAMLLAVACANIANLLLAQAHARGLEFGIRAAVGASPGRLIRQLWTESLALFGVAGLIGVVLSRPIADALVALYPETLPLAADVRIDARVLLVAAGCTLAAALLAGLPRTRRLRDTQTDLRADGRSSLTRGHRQMTTLFVAAQVAVSMVLLVGGILLLRTFLSLSSTSPGFAPEDVVTIRASIPAAQRRSSAATVAFQDRLRDTARSLPGVGSAAHAMFIPFTAGSWGDAYRRSGMNDEAAPRGPMAHFYMVSPEYLPVMGMPVLRGRGISATDKAGTLRVIVVSETFAKRAFPGQDAVGRRIDWNDGTWEIVGVTVDVRHEALGNPLDADAYVPRTQVVRGNTWLLVKTGRPAGVILAELQERMKAIDPDVALTDAQTMPQRLAASAAPERFRAIVTGTLAGLTLLLAIVGLHGVVSYAVAQRTREIGVRLALGQPPAAVARLVIGDTLRTIAIGAVPGVVASVYAGRWLSSVVAITANLPAALGAVLAIFVAAALAAAAGPALRAGRVDPIVALRS